MALKLTLLRMLESNRRRAGRGGYARRTMALISISTSIGSSMTRGEIVVASGFGGPVALFTPRHVEPVLMRVHAMSSAERCRSALS